MKTEIYTITHVASGKHYVGSSINAKRRFVQHKNELNKGTHPAKRLQNSWKKYGPDAFVFSVIETCNETERAEREQFYIDEQKPFFNWAMFVRSPSLDPKVGKQISEAMLGNQNTKGLKWSDEAKANLSKARTGLPQSEAQRAATIRSLELGREKSRANKPGWVPTHRIGVKDSTETIEKRRQSRLRTEATRTPRCWITDGIVEQQVEASAAIPEGWRRGRQPRIGEVGGSRVGEKRSDEARANMSKAHMKHKDQCELPL